MINLNECKFGDRLRTRDGRMAIFCGKSQYRGFLLVLEGEKHPFMLINNYDSDGTCSFFSERSDGKFDIVNRWEE